MHPHFSSKLTKTFLYFKNEQITRNPFLFIASKYIKVGILIKTKKKSYKFSIENYPEWIKKNAFA